MRKSPLMEEQLFNEEDYKFKRVLSEAIDESLNQTLGESASQTLYFVLEKHHLKKEDIPKKGY